MNTCVLLKIFVIQLQLVSQNVILKINVIYQKALCPVRDVPSTGNHDDPLSYYQIGDLIRGMIYLF